MSELIKVGKILKPQGIHGELKIKPIIDKDSRFESFTSFFVGNKKEKYKVISNVVRFGFAYVCLEGIETRNDAEKLRNLDLFIEEESFGSLDDDSYLVDDLIGLDVVFDGTNICAGKIIDIDQFGSADVVHVVATNGRVYQIPFLKNIFKTINLHEKVVFVDKNAYEETKL